MLNNLIEDQPVSTRWEPCPEFSPDLAASPVCAGCGWLEDEHATDAVVHHLPGPVVPARRLAS
jgi:hypothetical protein